MFEALLEIFVVSAFFGGPCSEEDPLERFARLPTIVRAREEALLLREYRPISSNMPDSSSTFKLPTMLLTMER